MPSDSGKPSLQIGDFLDPRASHAGCCVHIDYACAFCGEITDTHGDRGVAKTVGRRASTRLHVYTMYTFTKIHATAASKFVAENERST